VINVPLSHWLSDIFCVHTPLANGQAAQSPSF
jgi:hypothetical protein